MLVTRLLNYGNVSRARDMISNIAY